MPEGRRDKSDPLGQRGYYGWMYGGEEGKPFFHGAKVLTGDYGERYVENFPGEPRQAQISYKG